MKRPKKQAVLYVRANNTVEAEEQLKELWKFAESKGFAITNTYFEIISDTFNVHEHSMWMMLHNAEHHHHFDTVIIQDTSRISHKMQGTLFVLNELKALGVRLITQNGSATLLPFKQEAIL
jgi:DNA invertase Pin-like site-specific DNA recombinase